MLTMGKDAESKGLILRALALYKQGLKLDPQSKELKSAVDRLTAQLAQGEKDGSIHVDRRAPPSEDVEVLFKQAEVYVKYGLTEKALQQLDAILAKDPQHAKARALRATLK